MLRMTMALGAWVFAASLLSSLDGQTSEPASSGQAHSATPLAFAAISVKPAPPGTYIALPSFMRSKDARILGLQTMAVPVNIMIGYAYRMQISEALEAFRKQPDWTKTKIYTVSFRAEGEPTSEQTREMMQTMLAERFGLQIHEFMREGLVNKLVLRKPGVLGPNLKAHRPGSPCSTQSGSQVGSAPSASEPQVAHCGFVWYYLPGDVLHVEITDTTIAGAGASLASIGPNGLETHPIIDATGLSGRYDLSLDFRSFSLDKSDSDADDTGAPSLIRALRDQLGIQVESGEGPVRMVVIDHISQATPD